jgi:hypothetical protein
MTDTDEWLPIPEHRIGGFPFDGAPVVLLRNRTTGLDGVPAVWRTTRSFDPDQGKWVPTGFWAFRNEGGRPIDFEPGAYQRLEE